MPKIKRWVEISTEAAKDRFDCLSEQLSSQGLENEVEYFEYQSEEDWQKFLDERGNEFNAIRLGKGMGEAILKKYPNHSVKTAQLGAADCLIRVDQKWWPRSSTYEGLLRVFSGVGENFDLRSSALVVGAGAMARVAVAVLFREGFKSFGISAMDEERGRSLIRDLKRVYFGAEFEFIPKDELILLPGLYGLILNTTPSIKDNELLRELTYFNFFIPNGVAVDMYFNPAVTELLREAREVGAVIVPGYEIAAAADAHWVKWAFDFELDLAAYTDRLKSKFQSKV